MSAIASDAADIPPVPFPHSTGAATVLNITCVAFPSTTFNHIAHPTPSDPTPTYFHTVSVPASEPVSNPAPASGFPATSCSSSTAPAPAAPFASDSRLESRDSQLPLSTEDHQAAFRFHAYTINESTVATKVAGDNYLQALFAGTKEKDKDLLRAACISNHARLQNPFAYNNSRSSRSSSGTSDSSDCLPGPRGPRYPNSNHSNSTYSGGNSTSHSRDLLTAEKKTFISQSTAERISAPKSAVTNHTAPAAPISPAAPAAPVSAPLPTEPAVTTSPCPDSAVSQSEPVTISPCAPAPAEPAPINPAQPITVAPVEPAASTETLAPRAAPTEAEFRKLEMKFGFTIGRSANIHDPATVARFAEHAECIKSQREMAGKREEYFDHLCRTKWPAGP